MNALQGTDLAVDGLNTALATLVRRQQDGALDSALSDAKSAWEVASEWERYATSLKRQNEQMAQRLEWLEAAVQKHAEISGNNLKTSARYQHVLIARINELDERYQDTSAQLHAFRRRDIRARMDAALVAARSGHPQTPSRDRAAEFRSDVAEFMQANDVRLGVPSIAEAFR